MLSSFAVQTVQNCKNHFSSGSFVQLARSVNSSLYFIENLSCQTVSQFISCTVDGVCVFNLGISLTCRCRSLRSSMQDREGLTHEALNTTLATCVTLHI